MSQTRPGANRSSAIVPSNFPSAELPTTEPQVILAFHGLMSLTHKTPEGPGTPGFCEVGIHDNAPNHNFSVKVFDLESSSADPFYSFNFGPAHPSPIDLIRFDALNANPPNVGFYQPLTFNIGTATRGRFVEDPLDFRQVNDFEGPEFYNRPLEKHLPVFRPRILVKSGIFVTLVSSEKTFRREAPFDPLMLGKIAEIAGAGVYLQPNGLAVLRFGHEEVRLPLKPSGNTLYLFLFDNSCPPNVCKFRHDSPIKEERNDFFEYYKMFKIPEDKEEFELISDPGAAVATPPAPATPGRENFKRVVDFLGKNPFKESTNEAPCGPVGFGGGG
jgi:hypothetical protein